MVVTDVMMPAMTGWELLARIREDDRLRALPLIVIIAAGTTSVSGCDAFYTSPSTWPVWSRPSSVSRAAPPLRRRSAGPSPRRD